MMNSASRRRAYDNRAREAQARATRRRVQAAALELFTESGYAGTTLAAVAQRAGASVQTVQKAFGTKAALARSVYDVTLAGDDEPVPMAQRPAFREMAAETDPHELLRKYAAIGHDLWSRVGTLLKIICAGAASGDADLVELREKIARESRIASSAMVDRLIELGALRPGLSREHAVELHWWTMQPEQYVLLVDRLGWDLDEFQRWFAETLSLLLLGGTGPEHADDG